MGFFGGLNAEQYDRQYSDRQLIGRISEYFEPQKKRLLGFRGWWWQLQALARLCRLWYLVAWIWWQTPFREAAWGAHCR